MENGIRETGNVLPNAASADFTRAKAPSSPCPIFHVPNFEMLIAADGSVMVFTSMPCECPVCHQMRGILVNFNGRTRCWECDSAYRAGCAAGRIRNPVVGSRDSGIGERAGIDMVPETSDEWADAT